MTGRTLGAEARERDVAQVLAARQTWHALDDLQRACHQLERRPDYYRSGRQDAAADARLALVPAAERSAT